MIRSKKEILMLEIPSHRAALRQGLGEASCNRRMASERTYRWGWNRVALVASMCLVLIACIASVTILWPSSPGKPKRTVLPGGTSYYHSMSPEQENAIFENTHMKFKTIKDAMEPGQGASDLKIEVTEPKCTLGAELVGVYVAKPGEVSLPDVTLCYSNGMGIVFTQQTVTPDYAAQVDYMKGLDAQGHGSHTTYPFVTEVNGCQAMAQEHGQNADGSRYSSYVQWCMNGTNYMVSSEGLSSADLIKVAISI